MKYIIISENNFTNSLNKIFIDNSEITSINEFKNILELSKNNESIFLIDIDNSQNKNAPSLNGINLLKWLRLLEYNNHCILYSFQSVKSLIKNDPLNSILFSKGVTFFQLPFSPDQIINLTETETAERNNLLPFFRAEIDLVKIRHELANKWAIYRMKEILKIKSEEIHENYSIQVLKFLSEDVNRDLDIQDNDLFEKIENFKTQNKKIFFYDDLAKEWSEPLQKLFNQNSIEIIDAKQTDLDELIKKISEHNNLGCLLLDLRLENETDALDVLDYSGGKALLKIKEKFSSLPVIMFTATNKAESVRRLIEAGAEYVWTKEGVDDGINNKRTIQNTKNLLKEVEKALSKFKNENYQKIYEQEILISKVQIGNKFNPPIKNYAIYLDANYLIDSIKNKSLHLFYEFLLSKPNTWKIKIHEDVIREILNISQQDEKFIYKGHEKDRNNPYRVPVCRFLLDKIFDWRQSSLIWIENKGGQNENIKKLTNYNSPELPERLSLEKQIEEKNSFWKIFFSSNEQSNQAQVSRVNAKVNEVNNIIDKLKESKENLPDFEKLKLHADDTFINVISLDLNTGNVILVTDDNRCAHDVGNSLKLTDVKNREYFFNNEKKSAPFRGSYTNIYQHYKNQDFDKLLKYWLNKNEMKNGQSIYGSVKDFLPSRANKNDRQGVFINLINDTDGFLHISKFKEEKHINEIKKYDIVKIMISEIKEEKIALKTSSEIF